MSGCEEQIEHHPAGVLRSAEELPVRKNRFVIRRMPDFMTGCGNVWAELHAEAVLDSAFAGLPIGRRYPSRAGGNPGERTVIGAPGGRRMIA